MIKNPRGPDLSRLAQPRRRELLKQIGVAFECWCCASTGARRPRRRRVTAPAELPDDYRSAGSAAPRRKWAGTASCSGRLRRFPRASPPTRSSAVEDKILGKPADAADRGADAAAALRTPSTACSLAVAIKFEARADLVVSESRVRFCDSRSPSWKPTSRAASRPTKAGAYAIQGRAAAFVTELHAVIPGSWGCRCTRPRN